mmetsp:Transcript_105956/g.187466  ORF Transcript_105956/g.187466 Transcript_105956/m.187466 type:complete len:656 (+) Transcript_105956:62-2029(+)
MHRFACFLSCLVFAVHTRKLPEKVGSLQGCEVCDDARSSNSEAEGKAMADVIPRSLKTVARLLLAFQSPHNHMGNPSSSAIGSSMRVPVRHRNLAMAESRFQSWPITEAAHLEPSLHSMGLRLHAEDIDGTSTGKGCLSDAVVRLENGYGGTGSFISANGLILTNQHVVRLTEPYATNGFVGSSEADEIPLPDFEVWITRSCVDVTNKFAYLTEEPDPVKRMKLTKKRQEKMAKEAEERASVSASIRCEVIQMWPDESYMLVIYERLRDVRLVYAPSALLVGASLEDEVVGNSASADFALLRAYVAPNGTAADYATENIPYSAKSFIRIAQDGAALGDFIFSLGFPKWSNRHAPSSELDFFAEWLERFEGTERDVEQLKSLIEKRRAEEDALCSTKPEAKELLEKLSNLYKKLHSRSQSKSKISDSTFIESLCIAKPYDLNAPYSLAAERHMWTSELLKLQKDYASLKFTPDFNQQLRLSAGHVEVIKKHMQSEFRGDEQADTPEASGLMFGALAGIAAFALLLISNLLPDRLVDFLASASVGGITGFGVWLSTRQTMGLPDHLLQAFGNDKSVNTPFAIGTSGDESKGSSGSPILNADGKLVGLLHTARGANYFKQGQGTLADETGFAVDVRFILLILGKYSGAQWLVDEILAS